MVENLLEPIRIKTLPLLGLQKILLLSTTLLVAFIPVEIAVSFETKEERTLPLFFKKTSEFLPISLKVVNLVRLVAVMPMLSFLKRALLLFAFLFSQPVLFVVLVAQVVPPEIVCSYN